MKITLINLFSCPECQGTFLPLIIKKTKERVLEADLKCEKCGKKFHIKNGIAYFISPLKKQTAIERRELRKTTLKQEISKTWLRLFSKQELASLKKEWDWMLSAVKKEKKAIHLDFAAGTGRFLRNIIPKTKGEIIALDHGYSTCLELQYFLKKIKKYSRASIVCADARKMPFKDKVFDSITTWHGLDEVKMEKAIKESRRVLKNGACLAANGLHYQKGSKSFLIAEKEHIQFMTKQAIMEALKKAGFRKIQHKTFFQGRWNEKESYLPIFGDFYSTYTIKAKKS